MPKSSTKYQILKADFDHALKELKIRGNLIEELRIKRTEAYQEGYKQGRFDERMKDVNVFVVLYEHYLKDHKIEVIGAFNDEMKAKEALSKAREEMNFRDECWIVKTYLNENNGKTLYH